MRILVLSNMYPGARRPDFGIFVAERVDAYRQAGADVQVVANSDDRKGWRVPLKYGLLLLRAMWRSLRTRPDVIEAHYLNRTGPIGAMAALVAGARLVIYAHGSDVMAGSPRSRLVRWAVGRAAEVHTNSGATAASVAKAYPGAVTHVTPPGTDLKLFEPSYDPRGPVIGFVGRLVDYKGPDRFLQALPRVQTDGWRAVIVGSGPLLGEVKGLGVDLGVDDRIVIRTDVERAGLPEIFRTLAVLVVPSRREALGQVAIEALASGTPVIVADTGGLPEIPTSDCGSVVDASDPAAVAAAIDRWLGRRSEKAPKQAARARAEDYEIGAVAAMAVARYTRLTG